MLTDDTTSGFINSTNSFKQVKNAKELIRGIFAFDDLTKNGLRLNIQGHGVLCLEKGYICDSLKRRYSGQDIVNTLRKAQYDFSRYSKIRLICCHSAEGKESLAQQIATLTNLTTKGYIGVAWARVSNSMLRAYINKFDAFTDSQKGIFDGKHSYMQKGNIWNNKDFTFIENNPKRFNPVCTSMTEDDSYLLFSNNAGGSKFGLKNRFFITE